MRWLSEYLACVLSSDGQVNRTAFFLGQGRLIVTAGHHFDRVQIGDRVEMQRFNHDFRLAQKKFGARVVWFNPDQTGIDLAVLEADSGEPFPQVPLQSCKPCAYSTIWGYCSASDRIERNQSNHVGEASLVSTRQVLLTFDLDIDLDMAGFSGGPWIDGTGQQPNRVLGMQIESRDDARCYALPFNVIEEHILKSRESWGLAVPDHVAHEGENIIDRITNRLFPGMSISNLMPKRKFVIKRGLNDVWNVECIPPLAGSSAGMLECGKKYTYRLRNGAQTLDNLDAVLVFDSRTRLLKLTRQQTGATLLIQLPSF